VARPYSAPREATKTSNSDNSVIFIYDSERSNCIVMAEGGSVSVGDSVVTEECLQELLDFFAKSAYRAKTVDRRVSTPMFTGQCSP